MSDGAVSLALRATLPLMVVNYKPSSYWMLNSWDKFLIPKPFARLDIYHQIIEIEGMEKDEAKKYLTKSMLEYSIS
jgi:hypothetical protein